jgi:hypothetical protein
MLFLGATLECRKLRLGVDLRLFSRSLGAGRQIFETFVHAVQLRVELFAKAFNLLSHSWQPTIDLRVQAFV